jgi:hypothetical protein
MVLGHLRKKQLSRAALVAFAFVLLLSFRSLAVARPEAGSETSAAPPPATVTVIRNTLDVSDIGLAFRPTDQPARVSSEEALADAWASGIPGIPTSAVASYGALSERMYGGHQDAPAWLVTYSGACAPNLGPPESGAPDCLGSEWNVVVDGMTGDVVVAYNDQA